jgi:hypothetical protein
MNTETYPTSYTTIINQKHCNIHRETSDVTYNLYNAVKGLVTAQREHVARLHFAPNIYTGDVREVFVRCAFTVPPNVDNGSFHLICNPAAPNFKTLYIYYSNVGYSFDTLDEYFTFAPA